MRSCQILSLIFVLTETKESQSEATRGGAMINTEHTKCCSPVTENINGIIVCPFARYQSTLHLCMCKNNILIPYDA